MAPWENPDGKGEPIQKFRRVETTPGRMLLYQILPDHENLPFDRVLNRLLTKREITNVVDEVYRHCGQKETVIFADRLMLLGFGHAAKAGISFGKDDMVIPATKDKLVDRTKELVQAVRTAIFGRPDHQGREVQQGGRCLGDLHRRSRRRDDEGDPCDRRAHRSGNRTQAPTQLHLHDGGQWCAWFGPPRSSSSLACVV